MSEIERKPTRDTLAWFLAQSAANLDQQAAALLREISLKVEQVAALELAAKNFRHASLTHLGEPADAAPVHLAEPVGTV